MELSSAIKQAIEACVEGVYIIEEDTKTIVHVNEAISGGDPEAYIGRKCYEVFCQKDNICEYCPSVEVLGDQVYHWETYHHIARRWIKVKNKLVEDNGKMYRVGNINEIQDIMELSKCTLESVSSLEGLVSQQELQKKQLEWEADHDGMTGLRNRSCFVKDCERMYLDYHEIGLVYYDVNGLKQINDTMGHEFGDILINTVAQVLCKFPEDQYRNYRIGGDEFITILPEASVEKTEVFIAGVCADLEEINKHQSLRCEVAIGTSQGMIRSREDVNELMRRADEKMYQNKRYLKTL